MRVEQYLEQYLDAYTNYKPYWNYEDGCVLLGAAQMYEATGGERYVQFLETYLKDLIQEDGTIVNYQVGKNSIDSVNASKILFFMYDRTKEEKYGRAIAFTMEQLQGQPRCECGNFFHKQQYPYQIWLDGLYMAQPFYMAYETRFHSKERYNDILNQFENVRKYLYDEKKGLYYHAYDEKKQQFWCSKQTGCSPNFWLRSMGWYLMALVDVMDAMSFEIYEQYRRYAALFKEAVRGILQYQDPKTGLFYQVIDQGDIEGNYLETSGSAMVAYAILKACRMGILLKEKYAGIGLGILEGLIENKLQEKDGKTELTDICLMAGLGPDSSPWRDGSVAYYLSEKRVSDDAKGVGPFMMAYAQKLMLEKVL